ncbi:MAG: hypothetical protein QOJ12_2081 [Thermoleophilales bacterium]|nr:hypothetical protein [Thermoleophilales bacterium]
MARFRLLLVPFLVTCAGGAVVSPASAEEWPLEQQFPLVEPAPPVHGYPPPSSVVEDTDGALFVLIYWPTVQRTRTSESESAHTSLVRIAPDGSRTFVPPFGAPESEPHRGTAIEQVDDEILPLRDGSILFTRYNAIDRLRPNRSIVRFAGTGRYSEDSSGDGGRATAADIGTPHGLSRFPDGSIVFAEGQRIRRVARNGKISTIAGNGEYGFDGDGGRATAATLGRPQDVLPTEDGGFLIADTGNGRIRRVSPEGVISTIAGSGVPDPFGPSEPFVGTGDGGPATAAGLALPAHLARLPDGSLVIGEFRNIRRVAPDGTISTIFHPEQAYGDRLGDFAGRYGSYIEAMDTTREGGIAVIVSGFRLRALYLAPRHSRRTMVALRGARVSGRRVQMTVDATTRGLLQLEVRRRGKLVARASRRVRSGRSTISVGGRFVAADHKVTVKLRADRGGAYGDHIHVFISETLPKRLVPADVGTRCERIGRRRIDCEIHYAENEESGVPCLNTVTYRLFRSGLVFARPYGPQCHHEPMRFDRTPDWAGPWRASPPG